MNAWRIRFAAVITPLLRGWWRMRRPMTLGVRAIVTDDAGAVLLVKHTYVAGWHLPGGGVERGESALDAMARELEEEGGATPTQRPALIGCYSNHRNFPNDHILVYRIKQWRPCPPCIDNEIAERGYFALDALPADTTRGTRRRLAEVFDAAPVAPDW